MKKLMLIGASALLFASVVVDEASAQRGGFGGGASEAVVSGAWAVASEAAALEAVALEGVL